MRATTLLRQSVAPEIAWLGEINLFLNLKFRSTHLPEWNDYHFRRHVWWRPCTRRVDHPHQARWNSDQDSPPPRSAATRAHRRSEMFPQIRAHDLEHLAVATTQRVCAFRPRLCWWMSKTKCSTAEFLATPNAQCDAQSRASFQSPDQPAQATAHRYAKQLGVVVVLSLGVIGFQALRESSDQKFMFCRQNQSQIPFVVLHTPTTRFTHKIWCCLK